MRAASRAWKGKVRKQDGSISTTMEANYLILLPFFFSYQSLYCDFKIANPTVSLSHNCFFKIWKQSAEFQVMKIRSPAKDIRDHCRILKQ